MRDGVYACASLEEEGFIHASSSEQILEVANRYYPGEQDLVLLWIDPQKVKPEIRRELAENGQSYPHIYGPLNLEAVTGASAFPADADGIFRQVTPP
jgi:uncharacterized protein (DUF952 family)